MTEQFKDLKAYPVLRNIQYSPMKEGEEQYIVPVSYTHLTLPTILLV